MPVWSETRPTAASRRQISGTSSMPNQRSCICWRVVKSAKPRPNSSESSATTRIWDEFVMPLGMRSRIMKRPGVWRRKKTPAHLSRSRSPSVIACQPSAA